MGISINELLANPFRNQTRFLKEAIVREGKPRPKLERLLSLVKNQDANATPNRYVIIFDVTSYDHIEWLTGCNVRQALFCWPCLLFRTEKDMWNTCGMKDLNNLRDFITAHEKCIAHIQAVFDLQLFISKMNPIQAPAADNTKEFQKNREIVQMIVDSVCHLVTHAGCPRDKNTFETEDCISTLRFIRDYDISRISLIDEAIEKLKNDPKILTDVIEAITGVLKMSIFKEVGKSSYVSVILSEHSTDPAKSQLSTVLRYVKAGKVCERFVGFTNTDSINSYYFIFEHIDDVIGGFQIDQKVVAISFDGSPSYSRDALTLLKRYLRSDYAYAYFIPCYFHDLEIVLQENVCFLKECDLFCKNLTVLKSYFQEKSEFWEQFQAGAAGDVTHLDGFHSDSMTELLISIKNNRATIINFFDLLTCSREKLKNSDLIKIRGLRSFLTDFRSIFLSEAFIKLFDKVGPLTAALRSDVPGLAFDEELIDGVLDSICEDMVSGSYDTLWSEANHVYSDVKKFRQDTDVDVMAMKSYVWRKIFVDMVTCVRDQIKYRFETARKFSCFRILNLEQVRNHLNPDYVTKLNELYWHTFGYEELVKDIKLIAEIKPEFSQSLHEIYKFFTRCGLKNTFGKLCELLLTLPCSPPTPTIEVGGLSKLQTVNSRSCTSSELNTDGDITLLRVEQEYLEELRESDSFNTQVLHQFRERNQTLELPSL